MMSNKFYLKCFLAIAIAFGFQSEIQGEIPSKISTESQIDFQDRLSSPWENAVLTHTLEFTSSINTIKFSPDGRTLATVEASKIALWDTDQGEIQLILPSHHTSKLGMEIAPTAIAFSPNSRFLATATWSQGLLSPDRSIIVWDTTTGEEILSISESAGCKQVLFDVAGEVVYGACGLGVTAWSFPAGEKLFSFDLEYPVEAIAISPDGKVMATVDANVTGGQQGELSNQIQLWQLDQDKPEVINILAGHVNDIAQIEFTNDGKKLVSSSYDGKINVWHWYRGEIDRNNKNLHSNNGLFSLSSNSRLIAGNFHSSTLTNLITGLPVRNVLTASDRQPPQIVAFSPKRDLFARVQQSSDSDITQINLWHNNLLASTQKSNIEDEYLSMKISDYWHSQTSSSTENKEPELVKPSSIGKNPEAIALTALGLTEFTESEAERVETDSSQDNSRLVTITQTNLADDSISGIRYLVKFAPYGDLQKQLWQVVWAGQQFKCYRSNSNWSKEFCL